MFVANEDLSVFCTRGDYCEFPVKHDFKAGDVVRFKATRKKDCATVVIQRDFVVETDTDLFMITLSGDDTKIGEVISKPVDYWYEIELNPDTQPETIIAYDEKGAKIFRLYPEGKDVDGEDIEVVGHKTLQELVDYALLEAKETGMFDGEKGDPGYTPQRGVDYWTPEDEAKLTEALETANEAKETAEQAEANLIDKLCPTINESGAIVACEPVEGYPLSVQTDGATRVYRCGKNLLKPRIGITTLDGITFNIHEDGTVVLNGTATKDTWAYIAEYVSVKKGVTYTLSGCTDGAYNTYQIAMASSVIGLYNDKAPSTRVATASGDVPCRLYVYAGTTVTNLTIKPQLEIGSVASEREVYKETEEFAPGEAIPALDGVNTIWADSGDVTVTGKADPTAMFDKLTNAILSLGGNV